MNPAFPTPQSMDLLSLLITLRPAAPIVDQPLPAWWGRAAHALLLEVIRQADPALAEHLHTAESGPRPFTVSTLIGPAMKDGLKPETAYRLRLTAFQRQAAEILWQAAQPGGRLAPGAALELDYRPFRIEARQPETDEAPPAGDETGSPWAAATSYQALSAPYLLAQVAAPRRIGLSFTSPTTFKSGGQHVPLPLPGLVFGSLLEKWNAFAPLAFPPETRRYAEECLAISQYRLSTRPVALKQGGLRVGAVGQVVFTTLNYDRYWMSVIATLAAFARFSGVGAGASQGLGQCRALAGWDGEGA